MYVMEIKELKEIIKKTCLESYGESGFKVLSETTWIFGDHLVSVTVQSRKYDIRIDGVPVCGSMSDKPEIVLGNIKKVVYSKPLGFLEKYLPEDLNPQELFERGLAESMKLEYSSGKTMKISVKLTNGTIIKK